MSNSRPDEIFGVLAELMEKSPAFRAYAQKRAAAARPIAARLDGDDFSFILTGCWFTSSAEEDLAFALRELAAAVEEVPRFADYAQKIVPGRSRRSGKVRQAQLDFGPHHGTRGTVVALKVRPRVNFHGQKVLATDNWNPPGTGTRIRQILVGNKSQFAAGIWNWNIPTSHFGAGTLGSGVRYDVCQPGEEIEVVVEFLQDCVFDATIFGKAVSAW